MVNFVLDFLSSNVTMETAGNIQSVPVPTLDVSAVAIFEVSLDAMKAVFQYQTDAEDLVNEEPSDLKYQIDMASWPELNPANAMMDHTLSLDPIAISNASGNYANDKMLLAHDYVRYLALRLFNTHHGVDLFSNELELLTDLRTICGSGEEGRTWYDVVARLTAVSKTGDHAGLEGESDKYMTNATDSSDNLCKVLFEQMMSTQKARFADIDGTADNGFRPIPFAADDSIEFKLTINAAEGQEELTGVDAIPARSYAIKLVIVDGEPSNTEVAANESV